MNAKKIKDLIKKKNEQLSADGIIQFDENELEQLSAKDIEKIKSEFPGKGFMRLPKNEIIFFEWLKKNDEQIWDDLWDDDDEPYRVSLDFLNHFIEKRNGFPICDLENSDNYWFCVKHIKPKGKQKFEEINKKIENNKNLNLEELLIYEIVQGSTDVWHFSFRYKLPIKKVKEKIIEMKSDDILVLLIFINDLVKYLDF